MAIFPDGVFIPGYEPKTLVMPLCEHTMATAQGFYLTQCAAYLLRQQGDYEDIPRWKFITKIRAYYQMRGAIQLVNRLSEAKMKGADQ